jgi:hypothetical protein
VSEGTVPSCEVRFDLVEVLRSGDVLWVGGGGGDGGVVGLFDPFGAGEEDREEGETGLGTDDLVEVVAVHEEAEHAGDHSERGLTDDGHDGRDEGREKRLSLVSNLLTPRRVRAGRRRENVKFGSFLNDVESVESRDEEGEESEGLLGSEVADRSREDTLALGDGEKGDEGVRGAVS